MWPAESSSKTPPFWTGTRHMVPSLLDLRQQLEVRWLAI